MNCPKCGAEISENQKFCTKCGAKLDEKKQDNINENSTIFNKKIIVAVLIFLALVVIGVVGAAVVNNYNVNNSNTVEEQQKTPAEILEEINKYQTKYFEIVKRHDVLLDIAGDDERTQDLKELSNLYKEVENKLDKNNKYYIEYKAIEDKYKENPGETTADMNEFAGKHYDAVDKLLNDVYKAVKTEISEEDFKNLKINQRAWLKEVQAYNKVFEAQGFGTIRSLIESGYEIDMRNFRTLLLMLYLSEPNTKQVQISDSTFKSIMPIEQSELEQMSATGALNLMIQQEKDLKEFLTQNHTQEEYDNIFQTFYKNLLNLSGDNSKIHIVTDIAYDIEDKKIKNNDIYTFDDKNNSAISDIQFQVKIPKRIGIIFKPYKPKTDLFSIVNSDDECYTSIIDYNYLENTFAKQLSPGWQNYLKLKKQEYNDKDGSFFTHMVGHYANWIIAERNFIKKHPNFVMKHEIQKDINNYLGFMSDCDEDYCNYDEVTPNSKTVYEKFLQTADKSSKEYKAIKDYYDILIQNNSTPSDY